MTDSTSPFVLLRTASGPVSIDVRTIADTVTRRLAQPSLAHVLSFKSTISTDPVRLDFDTAEEADAAVTLLHAVREQHDDARAEDARAKVVGEAIRESGREFTQQIADVFLQSVMGLKDVLASTFAAGDAFRKLGEPPTRACLLDAERVIADNIESLEAHPLGESICRCLRLIAVKPHLAPIYLSELLEAGKATQHETGSTPRDAMLPQVEAMRKFLGENGYETQQAVVKANGLVQLHLTCGAIVSLYTTTGTAVVQGKPSDADRKAIIELLRIDEWKV